MPRSPDPIDAHVAQRLRLRRELAGYTQDRLGQAVGVSFQMIQKYEHGTSRVGASRLMKIAKVLGVPVAWFFEGFSPSAATMAAAAASSMALAQPQATLDDSLLHKKETLDLLKAYYALPESLRKHVLGIVREMHPTANATEGPAAGNTGATEKPHHS